MKQFTYLLLLFLFSCNSNNEVSNNQIITKEEDNVPNDSIDRNDSNANNLIFINSNKVGFILEGTHTTYNSFLDSTGILKIKKISEIKIIGVSKQLKAYKEDNYCSKANIIKLIYKLDTTIVLGNIVLEKKKNIFSNDSIQIFVAKNYNIGAIFENELSGCDEYGYLLINYRNEKSLIKPRNNEYSKELSFTALISNDGMEDSIISCKSNNDTIVIEMFVGYQEGTGTYNLNIYKKNEIWYSSETDRKRSY